MPIDDDRVIWNAIGEPPESPWGYAARNGISESEVPHEVFKAWRTWNQQEQALVEKAAEHSSGQSTDEILTSLGYKDEGDKGKSMFARYRSGEKAGVLENIAQDAWGRTVAAGHATWDPTRNAYVNIGTGTAENPSQVWDERGRVISGAGYKGTGTLRPIATAALRSTGLVGRNWSPNASFGNTGFGGMGGYGPTTQPGMRQNPTIPQQPTGPKRGDAGYRPMLRSDPNNVNYGAWGSAFNRPVRTGSARKTPTNTFGYQPTSSMGGY